VTFSGIIMKIEILEKCFIGTGGNLMAGEVVEIEDRIAEKLINRGMAKAKVKKAAPKKTNRAVKSLETPEDE
jgi:hypothetical protein